MGGWGLRGGDGLGGAAKMVGESWGCLMWREGGACCGCLGVGDTVLPGSTVCTAYEGRVVMLHASSLRVIATSWVEVCT